MSSIVAVFLGGPKCGESKRLAGSPWEYRIPARAQLPAEDAPTSAGPLVRFHLYARTNEVQNGAIVFEWQGIQ